MINFNYKISDLTVAEFMEIVRELQSGHTEKDAKPAGRLVYGLRGIQELFRCSHKTAQYYKDHVIQEAVRQNGRKIVVDADLALRLFNDKRSQAGTGCDEAALAQGETSTPEVGCKTIKHALQYGQL